MRSHAYSICLKGLEAAAGTISIGALRDLCDIFIEASMRTLRLAVEGTSTPAGPIPNWVKESVAYTITQLREGSTVVDLEAPLLSETAFAEIQQQDLWQPKPRPEDTALTVLTCALKDIQASNRDSDRYDLGTLKTLARFETFFEAFHTELELLDGEDQQPLIGIGLPEVKEINDLKASTPRPKAMVFTGYLEIIEHSSKRFKLRQEDGPPIRGRIQGRLSTEDLRNWWGQKVTVKGQANFTPSGHIRLIEADLMRLFSERDRIFAETARSHQQAAATSKRRPQGAPNFLEEIWGTWPGDEPIEVLLAALKDTRSESE